MRAPARRVPFLARRLKAGTHDLSAERAAFADAEASLGRVGERVIILREAEMRRDRTRSVSGSEAQVRIERPCVDDLARIHAPVRIPDGLELTERLYQLLTKHLRQQLALRLAIAVLTGERAAEGQAEIRGLVHVLAEFTHSLSCLQAEGHARVHAAVAEVAKERVAVAEAPVEL